jgi:hypothetical protein
MQKSRNSRRPHAEFACGDGSRTPLFAGRKGGRTPLTGCMRDTDRKILFFPLLTLTARLTAYHYYVGWGYVYELSC